MHQRALKFFKKTKKKKKFKMMQAPGLKVDPNDSPAHVIPPVRTQQDATVDKEMIRRKAWEIGKSPMSNIWLSMLMLYLSGDVLSVMSIMICAVMISGPVKSLMAYRNSFAWFEQHLGPDDASLRRSKLVYLAINLVVFSVAIYKIAALGVLPITRRDVMGWLSVYTTQGEAVFVKSE